MTQIDVDIFEPQGISKLDAQMSFLSKEQATRLIKKSFSGKEVRGTVGVLGVLNLAQSLRSVQAWHGNQAGAAGFPMGERGRRFMVGIPGELGTPGSHSNLAKANLLRLGKVLTLAAWSGVSCWLS